jgi:hypothetical protein
VNEHILFVKPSRGCLSTCAQLLTSMGESGVDPRCGFWGHGGSLILFKLCPKGLGMSERAYFICGTKQTTCAQLVTSSIWVSTVSNCLWLLNLLLLLQKATITSKYYLNFMVFM